MPVRSGNLMAKEEPKRIKIGAVARHFGISLDLLRLYEREGLLIPLKSPRGTRYYTREDYAWIELLLRLIREAHLTLSGIRNLLTLQRCWEARQCGEQRAACPHADRRQPCWVERACCTAEEDCYHCPVYRRARECEAFQALLPPQAIHTESAATQPLEVF